MAEVTADSPTRRMETGLKGTLGNPDLVVFFTSTISHKMLRYALSELRGEYKIVRSHVSSGEALRGIMAAHAEV